MGRITDHSVPPSLRSRNCCVTPLPRRWRPSATRATTWRLTARLYRAGSWSWRSWARPTATSGTSRTRCPRSRAPPEQASRLRARRAPLPGCAARPDGGPDHHKRVPATLPRGAPGRGARVAALTQGGVPARAGEDAARPLGHERLALKPSLLATDICNLVRGSAAPDAGGCQLGNAPTYSAS